MFLKEVFCAYKTGFIWSQKNSDNCNLVNLQFKMAVLF